MTSEECKIKRLEAENKNLNEQLEYYINGDYCDKKCNVIKALKEIKQLVNQCNNCDVEPPQLKFKCDNCKKDIINTINEKIKGIV